MNKHVDIAAAPDLGDFLTRTQWAIDELVQLGPSLQMDMENLKAAHAIGNADVMAKAVFEAHRNIEAAKKLLDPLVMNVEDEPVLAQKLLDLRRGSI